MAVPVLAGRCTSGAGVSGMAGVVDGSSTKPVCIRSLHALLNLFPLHHRSCLCSQKMLLFRGEVLLSPFFSAAAEAMGVQGLVDFVSPNLIGMQCPIPPFSTLVSLQGLLYR